MFDFCIRGARLRGRDAAADVAIQGDRIVRIEPRIGERAAAEFDAAGALLTESFVDPHLHLDKVYTLGMLDEEALRAYHSAGMAGSLQAIDLASRVKGRYDRAWILPNVRRALADAMRHGVTHVRAFADVDTKARLEGVAALLAARDESAAALRLEVVAFPQDGVGREPGAAGLVREAIAMGADVVGGIPWIEADARDAEAHIAAMFEIAVDADRPVSMLVDDAGDPALRTLERLARATLDAGWQGRVVAHHARAMALYERAYLADLLALLREAGVGLVVDPHTGPLHAPVRELRRAGVPVALGQDDVSDAYYPYGRSNALEVAFLASHLLWMTGADDREQLYDMITVDAARVLGLPLHVLAAGGVADLVVLDAPDLLEAFRRHAPPKAVVFRGRLRASGHV